MTLGIIGAGPTGLALNLFLAEKAVLLESESHVGGHASSFFKGGFTFDYGPHIMFSREKDLLEFMVRSLGDNVHKCRRNNRISFKRKLVRYPFENDLGSLPKEDNFECLFGFSNNRYKELYASPKNLREWLLKTFGQGICDKYLIPYNEKIWNLPVEQLSMSWADRIPNPPPEDIFKSALGINTEGYLHQLYYHYPLRGGYQTISENWAKSADISFNSCISTVSKINGKFIVSDGTREWTFDKIVSTMPIHHLIEAVTFPVPDQIRTAIKNLIVNPMYIISLGIRGEAIAPTRRAPSPSC